MTSPAFRSDGPLPRHVGIIMDGNGRWAQARSLPRSRGHEEGLKTAKAVTREAKQLGIPYLSLYVFSTENWKRAQEEVQFLMFLLKSYLRKEFDFYREQGIRVIHSGDLEGLPSEIRTEIEDVQSLTSGFSGLTVNLAINYGGRNEIVRAFERLAREGRCGGLTESDLDQAMDHPELPPVDLIIRTGGDLRLSNFLLWQSAYAELVFTEGFWPDFTPEDFHQALAVYQSRPRRFGGHDA